MVRYKRGFVSEKQRKAVMAKLNAMQRTNEKIYKKLLPSQKELKDKLYKNSLRIIDVESAVAGAGKRPRVIPKAKVIDE